MLQKKISQEFLVKIILVVLVLSLISVGVAFGLAKYKEKTAFKENIKNQAEKILELNNIKGYSLKSAGENKIKLPDQFEISKAILTESFPNFSIYSDSNVWQVEFNGETKELEYGVIFDPYGEYIIAAFVNDKRALPGVAPLKIKEENLIGDIIITTDKTEYAEGEYVKAIITSKLDKPIWYIEYCAKVPLEIYEFENGVWKFVDKTLVVNCAKNGWGEKIEAGETKNIDYFYNGLFEAGNKYKIGLRYGAKEPKGDTPTPQLENEEIIYSNEFMIK